MKLLRTLTTNNHRIYKRIRKTYIFTRVDPTACVRKNNYIATAVILSTLLIKQHYIADEIAGVTLAYAVGKPLFNHLWQKPNTPNLQPKPENTKT